MGIWQTGSGAPIVDGSGAIIECDDHPCDPCEEEGSCPTYPEIPDFLLATVDVSDSTTPAVGCTGCSAFDGSYALGYAGYNVTPGTCVERSLAQICQWGGNVATESLECDGAGASITLNIAFHIYLDGTVTLYVSMYASTYYKRAGPFTGFPITFTSADEVNTGLPACRATNYARECVINSITIDE